MSAEQRKQFEMFLASWFDEYDRALLAPKELSRLKAAYEAGHRSRDAEVQALRKALEELVSIVEIDQRYREQAWAFAELDMARAALAGEGGDSE